MKVKIRLNDAIDAHLVPQELRGDHIPGLLSELNDAIVNSPASGTKENYIDVSPEVATMAYTRLEAYAHNQDDVRRWSRYKIKADRIYDALKQAGVK